LQKEKSRDDDHSDRGEAFSPELAHARIPRALFRNGIDDQELPR
jgi:hypothetical protein